jgi:hypothetical protein
MTQAEINEMVQRNVDHLEIILAYTDPDVAGDSSDKSSYTGAIQLEIHTSQTIPNILENK